MKHSNQEHQQHSPFFTLYRREIHPKVDTSGDQIRTKQSFKDECDINNIMANYQRTGLLDYVNEVSPQYGDVTGIDFSTGMQTVARGREIFDAMPAKQRDYFENDPAVFFDFISDPANQEKAQELGLLPPSVNATEAPATLVAKKDEVPPKPV